MIILSKGNLWITFTDIYWLNILTNGDCGTEIVNYVQNTAVRQKKKMSVWNDQSTDATTRQ